MAFGTQLPTVLAPIKRFKSSLGDQFGNFADPDSQPGQWPLSLGGVIFASSECPDRLEFGLTTSVKLTKLIGGGLPTTVFGTYPDSVTWTGRIRAQNVDKRVASLRQMQIAQREITLTHRTESYYCYVSEFKSTRLTVDAEYSITVQVTRAANGTLAGAAPVSVDSQVKANITQASNTVNGGTLPYPVIGHVVANRAPSLPLTGSIAAIDPAGAIPLQAAVVNVSTAIASAGPIAQLTGSGLNSVLTTISAATSAAQTYAAKLTPVAAQFMQAQQLITTFKLMGRNVYRGQYTNTLQVLGGSLAEIAATHYGNADLGPVLGAANGIFGNRLPPGVLTTLQMPPFPITTRATT